MSGIAPVLDSLISSNVYQNLYLYLFSVFVLGHNEEEKYVWHSSSPGFSDLIRLFWLFSSSSRHSLDEDDHDGDVDHHYNDYDVTIVVLPSPFSVDTKNTLIPDFCSPKSRCSHRNSLIHKILVPGTNIRYVHHHTFTTLSGSCHSSALCQDSAFNWQLPSLPYRPLTSRSC